MRTLRDFLLLEGSGFPDGFTEIGNRGKLSDQAKKILGDYKIRGGQAKAETSEGKKNIVDTLKIGSPKKDPISVLYALFNATTNYNAYFFKPDRSRDFKKEDGRYIIVKMKKGWKDIGGKGNVSSSKKLIKFWLSSTIVAYDAGSWKSCEYAINDSEDLLYIKTD